MLKKILCLLFACALIFALVACGDDECTEHVDKDPHDGKCDNCGVAVPCGDNHLDSDNNCVCDICLNVLPHKDSDNNCVCDKCHAALPHVDADKNYVCDICGASLCTAHTDTNTDCICDICGAALEHIDRDGDHRCDKCDASLCTEHIDVNPHDAVCDVCGEELECSHIDADYNGKCDICGRTVPVNQREANLAKVKPTADAILNTQPEIIIVTTKWTIEEGLELNGTFTIIETGTDSAQITYTYERLNTTASSELVGTVSGTAVYENGKISGTEITSPVSIGEIIEKAKVTLDPDLFTFTIVGNTLALTVDAENIEAVTGMDLDSAARVILLRTADATPVMDSVIVKFEKDGKPAEFKIQYQ